MKYPAYYLSEVVIAASSSSSMVTLLFLPSGTLTTADVKTCTFIKRSAAVSGRRNRTAPPNAKPMDVVRFIVLLFCVWRYALRMRRYDCTRILYTAVFHPVFFEIVSFIFRYILLFGSLVFLPAPLPQRNTNDGVVPVVVFLPAPLPQRNTNDGVVPVVVFLPAPLSQLNTNDGVKRDRLRGAALAYCCFLFHFR